MGQAKPARLYLYWNILQDFPLLLTNACPGCMICCLNLLVQLIRGIFQCHPSFSLHIHFSGIALVWSDLPGTDFSTVWSTVQSCSLAQDMSPSRLAVISVISV